MDRTFQEEKGLVRLVNIVIITDRGVSASIVFLTRFLREIKQIITTLEL